MKVPPPSCPPCIIEVLIDPIEEGWQGGEGGRAVGHLISFDAQPKEGAVSVVALPLVVGVKKLFEPLDELKVVLEAALHQLVDRHDLKARARGQKKVILILKRKQEHTFSDIYNVNKEQNKTMIMWRYCRINNMRWRYRNSTLWTT